MKINDPPVVFLAISSISFLDSVFVAGFNVGAAWIISLPDLFNPNDKAVIKAIIVNSIPVIRPDLFKILFSSSLRHLS